MERNNKRWFGGSLGLVLTTAAAAALTGCAGEQSWLLDRADLDPTDGAAVDDGVADDDVEAGDVGTTETLRGFVHDPGGHPLVGVEVSAPGGFDAVSNDAGRFELPDTNPGDRLVMTFSKDGFATNQTSFTVFENGSNFFSQTMAPVDLDTEFDTEEGIRFSLEGTHGFNLPGGTILDMDGNPYDGTVSLQATVWDRTTPVDEGGEFLASPGDGQGNDMLGETHLLYTFGMFQLDLEAVETGEQVMAGPGVEITVLVPENSNLEDGDQVPYWDYNDTEGTWDEEDSGTIVSLPGGGQAWEFAPTTGLPVRTTTTMLAGNPDKPILVVVSATASGNVTTPAGEPVVGAPVRVIAADQTFMVSTQTDASGAFSVSVPPVVGTPVGPNGRPMFVEVDYLVAEKPSLWRQNPIAPPGPGGVASFGDVVAGSMTCLAGTVIGPDGGPYGGAEVTSPHGGNTVTEDDGSFCMAVPKWQPSTVYALGRPDTGVGFEPITFRPVPSGAGNCESACTNVVEIQAYAATSCASGEVRVDGLGADGLRIDAFDARYPSAPVFSTVSEAGEYCVTIPADREVTVRVGAGDNLDSNACASYTVDTLPSECGDDCAVIPSFDCGQ